MLATYKHLAAVNCLFFWSYYNK